MTKRNREKGAEWELYVRKYLESHDWNIVKFHNNVNLEKNKMIGASPSKFKLMQTGFPDFMCWKPLNLSYHIIGVECKIGGMLSRLEKIKCLWFLENNIFNSILIASKYKVKNRVGIKLEDFTDKYKQWIKKYNEKNK